MCVAGLNVSTQPCGHRWLRLIRPCDYGSNLENCTKKLKLEGWEQRQVSCPVCDGVDGESALHQSTHRILGGRTTSASAIHTTPVSPEESRGRSRSSSQGTLSSLSRTTSNASDESDRWREHRDRNDRLLLYLSRDPHEVLPSAQKNYPTSPTDERSESASLRGVGVIGKRWRKSARLGRGMFKA